MKTGVIEKSNSIASTKATGRFMLAVIFFEVIMDYFYKFHCQCPGFHWKAQSRDGFQT